MRAQNLPPEAYGFCSGQAILGQSFAARGRTGQKDYSDTTWREKAILRRRGKRVMICSRCGHTPRCNLNLAHDKSCAGVSNL